MRVAALAAPVLVLALMHVLQRMEVWATDTGRRTVERRQTVGAGPNKATAAPTRQSEVSRRRVQGEASHHA